MQIDESLIYFLDHCFSSNAMAALRFCYFSGILSKVSVEGVIFSVMFLITFPSYRLRNAHGI